MRINREKVKTLILFFLILVGIILTGNLWGIEGYRFPFIFAGQKNIETKQLYKSFFTPTRIIANDGEGKHWTIFPASSREKNDYSTFWTNLASPLIKAVFEQKYPVKYEGEVSPELWEGLISLKNFRVEFRAGLEGELLAIFFDLQKDSALGLVNGLKQIVFAPWESVNDRNMTLYIKDKDDKCHKLVLTLNSDEYKKEFTTHMKELNSASNKARYLTLGEQKLTRIGNNISLSPEIMVAQGKNLSNLKYPEVTFLSEFEEIDLDKVDGASELAEKLLGEDKDNYRRYIDGSGMVSFIHLNNTRIFRIYPDGFVECYNNRQAVAREKIDIGQAYIAAIDFIYRYGGIPEGIHPFLSSHSYDGKNTYTFDFDYFVEGLPVITTRPYRDGNTINSAIKVVVTGGEVESYLRYVKRPMTGKTVSVNVDTIAALNKFLSEKTELNEMTLDNIFLAYDSYEPSSYPFWFFAYKQDNLHRISAVKR